jgi:hypothetical protein
MGMGRRHAEEAIVCHRGSSLTGGGAGASDGASRNAGVGGGRGGPQPGRRRRLDSSTSNRHAPRAQESSEPATTTLAVSGIEQQEHPRV